MTLLPVPYMSLKHVCNWEDEGKYTFFVISVEG
jgi:hypothetical protein